MSQLPSVLIGGPVPTVTPSDIPLKSGYDGDFEKMNEDMKENDWKELHELYLQEEDDDGSLFMENLRLTTLQLASIHCPKKKSLIPTSIRTKPRNKKKQVLKRR